MTTQPLPETLVRLAELYADQSQQPVVFNPESWADRLSDVVDAEWVRETLTDANVTSPATRSRQSTTRKDIQSLLSDGHSDDEQLLRAFLLVMAWGNGTRSRWGFQNTARAFQDKQRLIKHLRDSRAALRQMSELDTAQLQSVAREWDVPGVRQSFYSKWFTFAGYVDERPWQPLILDYRVARTLSRTMGSSLFALTGEKRGYSAEYALYVELLHEWASQMPKEMSVTASKLEWILFQHNGKELPN